jgi:N-acetylglucosamine malate deacetylase 2
MSKLQDVFIRATLGLDSRVPAPSAVLVFAHPDDETVGLGARLPRYRSALIVHVTDGAPHNRKSIPASYSSPEEYRARRSDELRSALGLAGLEETERIGLQIPDQQASLHLAELVSCLHKLLLRHSPEVVFTHPYEGGHPDHDACAFAVQRAAARLEAAGPKAPMVIEAAFYHLGSQGIETGCFLTHAEKTSEIICRLSPEERRKKRALIAAFPSQQETLKYFESERECFRVAPKYDFHRPPHEGRTFYDRYPWGMTSQRFCELTREADNARTAATA